MAIVNFIVFFLCFKIFSPLPSHLSSLAWISYHASPKISWIIKKKDTWMDGCRKLRKCFEPHMSLVGDPSGYHSAATCKPKTHVSVTDRSLFEKGCCEHVPILPVSCWSRGRAARICRTSPRWPGWGSRCGPFCGNWSASGVSGWARSWLWWLCTEEWILPRSQKYIETSPAPKTDAKHVLSLQWALEFF